jgi:CheY-like chemotaxis protein/HPt (histidine-containing phosphotransfer) domain-containing protein
VEGLLKPYGMEMFTCQSGAEAVRLAETERYDLLFMDHMMPEMNGIEAVARIREMVAKDSFYASMPIIALTANAVSGSKEMFLENGFDDFLSKPIDSFKLNQILERWLPKEKQLQIPDMPNTGFIIPENSSNEGLALLQKKLDTKKGIDMAGGSVESYFKILAVFCQDADNKIQEIGRSLEIEDLSLYTIYLHALTSACANIGAEDLSKLARELEAAGKKGDAGFIHTHNSNLIMDLKELLSIIKTSQKVTAEVDPNEKTDIDMLKKSLSGLKAALEDFDSAKIQEAVGGLQKFARASDVGATMEVILQNVLIGEYDEATALIEAYD